MLESDADRLESIKALGGLLVRAESGDFWAIFDAAYIASDSVDEAAPALTARTSDVQALKLRKGSALTVDGVAYQVRNHEPDGTGISVVRLAK